MQRALKIIDPLNLINLLAHQVIHDHYRDGFHEVDFHCEDAVEAGKERRWVLFDVLMVLVEDAFPDKELQFVFFQSLNDELVV